MPSVASISFVMLQYSIYLVRAAISAIVVLFMLFVNTESFGIADYRRARVGVAIAGLLDFYMDVWACWMMVHDVDYFRFHWVWVLVYYAEWTILGYCVLRLVGSRFRHFWFTPLLLYRIIADSRAYRAKVDDLYAGSCNEKMQGLSYTSPALFLVYFVLTLVDLLIVEDTGLDDSIVALSSIVIVLFTIIILNLPPGVSPEAVAAAAASGVPDAADPAATPTAAASLAATASPAATASLAATSSPAASSDLPAAADPTAASSPASTSDVQAAADPAAASALPGTVNLEDRVREWELRPDKPFCAESLSLFTVADQMRVTPRALSNYINYVRMVNFNTWINELRVGEIERMIRENPDADITDLMVGSGFSSRTSISRAVKSATGLSITALKSKINF